MAVGRFQVMALLQAARASVLGLPLESACSWGLNRAIFIAAAKRGFKGGGNQERDSPDLRKKDSMYHLGDDSAFKKEEGGVLLFTIGGKVQTNEDFEKQVKARFGGKFAEAWKEAMKYVKEFDNETLLSSERFYAEVYRPRRDELAQKWTEASEDSG